MQRHTLHIVLLAVIALLFTSCDVPIGVLDKEKMASVLVDVHIAEATVGQKYTYRDSAIKRAYFDGVFEKHGITHEKFDKSLEWYANHPRLLSEVYEVVVEQLVAKRDSVINYAYHPEENPAVRNMIDSINIWLYPSALTTTALNHDSLHFALTDSTLFGLGEKYLLHFCQTVKRDSTTKEGYLRLIVEYADSSIDTIACYRLNDKAPTHNYNVRFRTKDMCVVKQVYGDFYVTSNDTFPTIQLSDIQLWRYYNKENVTIDSALVAKLDSIHHTATDTVKKSESNKEHKNIKGNQPIPQHLLHRVKGIEPKR